MRFKIVGNFSSYRVFRGLKAAGVCTEAALAAMPIRNPAFRAP